MNIHIWIVCYGNLGSNGTSHATHLLRNFSKHEMIGTLVLPEVQKSTSIKTLPFKIVSYLDMPKAAKVAVKNKNTRHIVVAWTPRETIRAVTNALTGILGCQYFVHLEDNEYQITADQLGITVDKLHEISEEGLLLLDNIPLSHPKRMAQFLVGATGVTKLVDRLEEFIPDRLPNVTFWPATDETVFYPQNPDSALRDKLGIPSDAKVVVYHGNSHASNIDEIRSLYISIGLVSRRGTNIRLVRLGTDYADIFGSDLDEVRPYVIQVGTLPQKELGPYLSLADVFVQPGKAGPFNDFRFPSKIPDFLAMGRPTILPRTNIGLAMCDGEDALLLKHGSADEIAAHLERIFANPSLAASLARGARRFYDQHLGWDKAADTVASFLCLHTTLLAPALDPTDGFVGYGTVADYVEGLDIMPELNYITHDIKDMQRPWTAKAVECDTAEGTRSRDRRR